MDSFDIARLAGVSRRTVQRVLNNPDSVKAETREKIKRLMDAHRYEPNSAARKLSARKTHTIGLFLLQDSRTYTLHTDDLFFGAVIGAIISRNASRGYNTMVSMLEAADPEPMFSMYRQKGIDGGIIVSWSDVRRIVEQMREAGYSVGVFDEGLFRDAPPEVPIPHLDNYRGAGDAARYLAGLGHARIGMVAGDAGNHTARERSRGFADALREMGMPLTEEYVYRGDFTEASGERAVEHWLRGGRLPEAVFCSNDLMAYGALKALARRGIRVPDEISVMGFDDLLLSKYMHPALTTMCVPRVEMAVQLADRLIAQLEGEDEENDRQSFSATLVERSSCAPSERNRQR